jgi:hypothetical protein
MSDIVAPCSAPFRFSARRAPAVMTGINLVSH